MTTAAPEPELAAEAQAVYAAAFGQPPYGEDSAQAEAFTQRLQRYAREREGFRFVVVRGDAGALTGIALAVLARPGDWWRDEAASALSAADAARWIGQLCLEVVHIAVAPPAQGEGVGRLLHDVLIAGSPAPVAVLSCHPAAEPAQRLYLGRGWTRLTSGFRVGGDLDYWLMARDL
jgi:GNAT superfamily N-acetyltransferase